MYGENEIGSSGTRRDESEIKQKEPVRQREDDDAERDLEMSDLRIHVEGEDEELTQLRNTLEAAKARHTTAEQDVRSPGWGRWVKYIFVTATDKANTVESSDFTVSRIALVGAVGIAGTAVSYLLPAFDMSEIQSMDRSMNTTATQPLTDHANVVYYWGNAASLGFTSIATFIGGLAGIRKSYKAMRERILAQATLERDQAQLNYDTYVKYTSRLEEMQKKRDAAQESGERAAASALRTGKKLEAALRQVGELEQALGAAKVRLVKLEGTLELSEQAVAEEHEQVRELKSEIAGLQRKLDEARTDSEVSRQEADKQREEADQLDRALAGAKQTIEKQHLRIEALEHENTTSKHVISMLETAIVKIDQADHKIETVSAKLTLWGSFSRIGLLAWAVAGTAGSMAGC